ncbi:hypothetical protein WBG78_15980 [Chryseolinea sp. T2]|uniref:hypothetical protein n=1 Tax=Chryseolinea sp. T2 TaxID=3129255 RepID=UPI003077E628
MKFSVVITAAIVAISTCATIQATGQEVRAESSSSTSERHNGRSVNRWRNTSVGTDFNVETRGTIELTDDDKDIKSLSNDGYLEITKTVFGARRQIVIESLGGGKIKREYYEGRTKMEWDPNGKNWLGEILPELVRSTTLGAEGRVNRIFQKGGAKGVLDEIDELHGDYAKAHYAKLLLEKNIPSADMASVVSRIADDIHSDYYLATVYQNHVEKMLVTPASADAFYQGTQRINSDYYKTVVLKEALKKFSASPSQIKTILQAAASIKSDYYLSVVLSALLEEDNLKDESLTDLIAVSANIPSAYYRTQVLSKALEKKGLSARAQKELVASLSGVSSDYYKTGVVTKMAEGGTIDKGVQTELITLVSNSVGSDYYSAIALKSLLEHQQLSDASFKQVVIAGGKLNSANYASEVLKRAGEGDLNKEQLIELIKATSSINSDHYLTEVLTSIASQVKNSDQQVKDAYRQAAKRINNDTYYGRVLKAID